MTRHKAWTADEDERLTTLWQDHVPVDEIARKLPGRTRGAIAGRASKLDLPLHACRGGGRKGVLYARRYDQEDD